MEPSLDLTLQPGTVVGGYRVVGALAEGGMGTVYEVEQIATGARRALKVLHGRFANNEDLRQRFVREARLTAVIPSDHVAQVLDAGHDPATGTLYIVMELLEGSTLSREIRRRDAFAWTDAVEIVRQIAHALGAAHARGIVHRDLKPANVFLSRSRHVSIPLTVKVLDFGIAKAIAGANDVTATVLGTPAWMAPEQTVMGSPVGPQADVWALGLLAFLLLTGKHYFHGANLKNAPTEAILREVVVEPIVPASVRAGELGRADRLPPDFDAWFARCVNRDPTARFSEAPAAYEAFAQLAPPTPHEPVPATISVDPPAAMRAA
jgi:serine/threonine protein kinase